MMKRRGRPWQYARFMIRLNNETLYSVFDIRDLITSAAFEAMKEDEPNITKADASARVRDSLNGQRKKLGEPYGQTTNHRSQRADAWPGAIWKELFDADLYPSQVEHEIVQQLAAQYQEIRKRQPQAAFETVKQLAAGRTQEEQPEAEATEPVAKRHGIINLSSALLGLAVMLIVAFSTSTPMPLLEPLTSDDIADLETQWLQSDGTCRYQAHYSLKRFPIAKKITLARSQPKEHYLGDPPR